MKCHVATEAQAGRELVDLAAERIFTGDIQVDLRGTVDHTSERL